MIKCLTCGESKPDSQMSLKRGKPSTPCKSCNNIRGKIYRDKNKDDRKKKAVIYYKENKERILKSHKEYKKTEHAKELRRKAEKLKRLDPIHKKRIAENQKRSNHKHKEKREAARLEYVAVNKDKIKARRKQFEKDNPDHVKAKAKINREKGKEKAKITRKEYVRNNKEKIRQLANDNHRARMTNPLHAMTRRLRGCVTASLKRGHYKKNTLTHKLLGESFEVVPKHLKQTWFKNYGVHLKDDDEYQIDHIIPCAFATNEQEAVELQHYKNLQLLKPEDNLEKADRLDWMLGDNIE